MGKPSRSDFVQRAKSKRLDFLRHTGCTRMAESGMDIKTLQYIMGHATLSITMDIYNHIDNSRVISEMQKVEGKF